MSLYNMFYDSRRYRETIATRVSLNCLPEVCELPQRQVPTQRSVVAECGWMMPQHKSCAQASYMLC